MNKLCLIILILASVKASSLPAEDEALTETQKILVQPQSRAQVLNGNAKAQQADQMAKEVMGENSEDLYKVSAELMSVITQQTSGDPEKMKILIDQASRNPTAFYQGLPKEFKEKISDLADKSALQKKQNPK